MKILGRNRLLLKPLFIDINFDTDKHLYCGKVSLDFRVFDLESEAIDRIIKNGLKGPTEGQDYNTQEARDIISEFSGIGIFREDFRIRPYGEEGNDWLGT